MAHTVKTAGNEEKLGQDPAKDDLLILVDEADCQVGTASKERVHREGLLHRAFSVVLWREGADGPEVMLSRRAACKYHSAGLWTNSCCSHPRNGEDTLDAAARRIREELGCTVCGLREIGSFTYRADFASGLVEHEYDHVLLSRYEGDFKPNPDEIDAVRWIGADALSEELLKAPEHFTAWAPRVLSMALEHIPSR